MKTPKPVSGVIKICDFPAEVISVKIIRDRLVVECSDGVTYIITEDQFEEKPRS